MEEIRNYQRCSVMGEGELYIKSSGDGHTFHVIDMSATGISIRTEVNLEPGAITHMKIRFSGHIVEVPVNTEAEVVKKEKIGKEYKYALRFKDLSHQDRIEIDEVIRRTCSIGSMIHFDG